MTSRRVRVVYCLDSFEVGGTELNAVRTAEVLDTDRFELSVVYLQERGPLRARYEKLGVRMVHLPIGRLYAPRTARQGLLFGSLLRSMHADVLHAHDLYTNIFAAPWARLAGGRCRVVASRRWWFDAPRRGLVRLNRWSYGFAHVVLANSPSVARLLTEVEHVPAGKVVVIPNFLADGAFAAISPEERLARRRAWGIPDEAFVVGAVGRLAPVKNLTLLLRAAAMLGSDVHVVLVGDGPSRLQLELLGAELGMTSRVHFTGQIVSAINLHQLFDLSVLCSDSEGFPNSLIEAMAAARPVISTPVGGVEDVVQDGRTGLLLREARPDRLAGLVERLRSSSQLRASLGSSAQLVVESRFHQRPVLAALSALYERLSLSSPLPVPVKA